jgi:hypothetical protein
MLPQKQPVKSSEKAAETLAKWSGDKQNAIKDIEGSIEDYAIMHPFNRDEPPVLVRWLIDVIEEIKKL